MTGPPGRFACGPLEVTALASDAAVEARLHQALSAYGERWPAPLRPVAIAAAVTGAPPPATTGTYLACARMLVDREGDALVATTTSGVHGIGHAGPDGDCWRIAVPPDLMADGELHDLDDIVGLALTTGWRQAGWVPVHAAAVADGDRVALVCSASGGGKSTLTVAMVERGWRALGDDKVLLRIDERGRPEARSLLSTFNLDPRTREWVPAVGSLDHLPPYSVWTDKRRVEAAVISPEAMMPRGQPTHLVHLVRGDGAPAVRVSPLSTVDVTATLLRQVAFPSDAAATKPMLAALAAVGAQLTGVRVEVGPDAYRHTDVAASLEAALS